MIHKKLNHPFIFRTYSKRKDAMEGSHMRCRFDPCCPGTNKALRNFLGAFYYSLTSLINPSDAVGSISIKNQ